MHSAQEGKAFEKFLTVVARHTGWQYIKLPAGARFIGNGKHVLVKGPFDFIFQKNGKLIFCDAKSVYNDVLKFSLVNQDQVTELQKLLPHKTGYMVEFKEINQIGFIPVKSLVALRPRQSISYDNTIPMGSTELFRFERLFDDDTEERSKSGNAV